MWHPLRLAEDYATADILTKRPRRLRRRARLPHPRGRGLRRADARSATPTASCSRSRSRSSSRRSTSESFSHQGKHYTLPPSVPYRGYELKEITLVPRPVHRRSSAGSRSSAPARAGSTSWRGTASRAPSAAARRPMAERSRSRPIATLRARAGKDRKLGENLTVGIFFHIADSRRARRSARLTPVLRGAREDVRAAGLRARASRPPQVEAAARRGGWKEAGVPTLEHYMKLGVLVRGHARAADRAPEEARGALSRHGAHQSEHQPVARPRP